MHPRRTGFTFVEILLAMAIFGILSAVALPKYRLMKDKAYKASLRADLGELRIAEESFWAENQMYSTDASQLDWRPTTDVTVVISSSDPSAGFQATARHTLMTGTECSTYMGRNTMSGIPSGEIVCGPASASPPVAGPPAN